MPRDIKRDMRKTPKLPRKRGPSDRAKRVRFLELMKQKQQKKQIKKAPKKKRVSYKELRSRRSIRLVIREAAENLNLIQIRYKKLTTGRIRVITIEPYELTYRILKIGRRKVLFGYDVKDGHIKTFALMNIRTVKRIPKRFSPRWPIKI